MTGILEIEAHMAEHGSNSVQLAPDGTAEFIDWKARAEAAEAQLQFFQRRLAVIELEAFRQMEGWINEKKQVEALLVGQREMVEALRPFAAFAVGLEHLSDDEMVGAQFAVPVKPTELMIFGAKLAVQLGEGIPELYRAMLAAAPSSAKPVADRGPGIAQNPNPQEGDGS